MPKKYYNLTDKGNELMEMLQPELENSRLRKVIDYEVGFALRSYEMEINEKEKKIAEKDKAISEKKDEIKRLKKLLKDNNIDY